MLSPSRFTDPCLDTLLVPEDFAAVSRFCAETLGSAAPMAQRAERHLLASRDAWLAFCDVPAGGNGQLRFENI